MAVVASLETLLCVEATDKMDLYKRVMSTDRELTAQGIGNVVDATRSMHVDLDVYEVIRDFEQRAKLLDIDLTIRGLDTLRRDNNALWRLQRMVERQPTHETRAVAERF